MLTLLIEHQTLANARRALMITAVLTILSFHANIAGNGLEILGLTISIEQSSVVTSLRFLTAYFTWVFFWLSFSDYYAGFKDLSKIAAENAIKRSEDAAREADNEMMANDSGGNYEIEPESWWMDHYVLKKRKNTQLARWEFGANCLKLLKSICVDFGPAALIGVATVIAPDQVSTFVYGLPSVGHPAGKP